MSILMTQTLPTVVGMGVVSRAVDTTMGRRRSGSAKGRPKSQRPKVHKGPRGGRYIMRKGRKVYI